jgi:hypothetical protein
MSPFFACVEKTGDIGGFVDFYKIQIFKIFFKILKV